MLIKFKQQIESQWQSRTVKLREWWANLSQQEKRAVSIGGSILGLFLLYTIVWSPSLDHLAAMRKRIKSDEHTLSWMQGANAKIKALSNRNESTGQTVTPVALMSELQKQINQNSLGQSLKQLKQAGNDTIEISFKQVNFDKAIDFLIAMMKQYKFSVEQMSSIADKESGMVDLELILKL